ncbi:GtrA family protein [Rhizobium sp. CF122]|uniref:GtrA family protein n=1 Tax=Rhizobium sp. CF122 TaxID=1144312 RepID=UPI0002E1CE9A|nr:GtrA family protein [Rhizobium sp. CF122]
MKFVLIGIVNTLAYFVIANLFVYGLGMGRSIAAFATYALLVPVSFLAHRRITFRSKGSAMREWAKFCVMQFVSIAVIAAVNREMSGLPQSDSWVVFGIISVLIPLINFAAMQLWVFAARHGR